MVWEQQSTSSSYATKRNSKPEKAGEVTAVLAVGQVVGYWVSGRVLPAAGIRQLTTLAPDREIGFYWNYLVNGRVVGSPLADR